MENLSQYDDGTAACVNAADGVDDLRMGGPSVPSVASPRFYVERVMKVPLAAGVDTGGGIVSWQNMAGHAIIVTRAVLDVTTAATASCTVEVGEAAGATTASSNLVTGQDVHTATGTFTGGADSVKVPAGAYITASTATGACAGLVGNLYLHYHPV
jgi:hypothetical protein